MTPVDSKELKSLLIQSKYNVDKINFLIDGFENGFTLGYNRPENVQIKSPNLKFRGVGNKTILWNKVMKEVKLKRYAGPFSEIPFDSYIQSPIGLVPKDNGKDTRLIFHLSYPRNAKKKSVNANIPKELCSVEYPDFDKAIQLCLRARKSCKISKSDMRSAFRNLKMKKSHWRFLVMKAQSPLDEKIYYFVDKCLPFGSSISCAHFQAFSNAIAHIVKWLSERDLLNYLNDFLFVALMKAVCNNQLKTFLKVCEKIRFPVSLDKTFWSSTLMTFLGLLINTVEQTVSIPTEKIIKARILIGWVLDKKKITIKQLEKICGFLNFLCRCVLPGRAFTRRLYMMTQGKNLKSHHHIHVSHDMRQDLLMWQEFINHPSIYCRGFYGL